MRELEERVRWVIGGGNALVGEGSGWRKPSGEGVEKVNRVLVG